MSDLKYLLNVTATRRLENRAVELLEMFHRQYDKNPVSRETEFERGKLTGFRQTLIMILGETDATKIINAASQKAGLTIPHGGTLTKDGDAYEGMDSGAHMYIGKL